VVHSTDEKTVQIGVRDSGPGVSPEILERATLAG